MKVFVASFAFAAVMALGTVAMAEECIVGVWKPEGNGAAEWMRRSMPPGVAIPRAENPGYVVYKSDGTFLAASTLDALMTARDAVIQGGEAHLALAAQGLWKVVGDRLTLTQTVETHVGDVKLHTRDGTRSMPAPPVTGGHEQAMTFTCAANELMTRMTVRGAPGAIVQRYTRVRS